MNNILRRYPKFTTTAIGFILSFLLLAVLELILQINSYYHWFPTKRREPYCYSTYEVPPRPAIENQLKKAMQASIDQFVDYPTRSNEEPLIDEGITYLKKYPSDFDTEERGHNKNIHYTSQVTTKVTGTLVYKVDVSLDGFATRAVPSRPEKAKEQYVFNGDSFIFGEGANDNETMPEQFQKLRSDVQVYNLAIGGDAPNDILYELQFHFDERYAKLPIENGSFFYFFIQDHIDRSIVPVSYMHDRRWVLSHPYYELDRNKNLIYKGILKNRTSLNSIYSLLDSFDLVKLMGLDWPSIKSRSTLNLFVNLIKEIKFTVETKMKIKKFYFVFYPQWSYAASPNLEHELKDNNIEYIDLRIKNVFKLLDKKDQIPVDRHPSPLVHELTALYLNKKLNNQL